MTDIWSKEKRSSVMRLVGRRNTTPERRFASRLRRLRIRYRSQADLPGTPDFVLVDLGIAVFIHGCFWHGCPRHYSPPQSHVEFWKEKLTTNRRRDRRAMHEVRERGWRGVVIWECETKANSVVLDRLILRKVEAAREWRCPRIGLAAHRTRSDQTPEVRA